MTKNAYAQSGVDVEAGYEVVERIKKHVYFGGSAGDGIGSQCVHLDDESLVDNCDDYCNGSYLYEYGERWRLWPAGGVRLFL